MGSYAQRTITIAPVAILYKPVTYIAASVATASNWALGFAIEQSPSLSHLLISSASGLATTLAVLWVKERWDIRKGRAAASQRSSDVVAELTAKERARYEGRVEALY